MKVLAALLVGFAGYGLPVLAQQRKEPYKYGRYQVRSTNFGYDPNPKWVTVAWKPEEDKPFYGIREETGAALADPAAQDTKGHWAGKAKAAYEVWIGDSQNPAALARASAYLGVARTLDQSFDKTKAYLKMKGDLNDGWAILQKVPTSYQFARFGYLFNAGDNDYHKYGDLAERLWKKNPKDRGVALATVGEYRGLKPNAPFERAMFERLEIASGLPNWRATDDWTYALAYRLYGRNHADAGAYVKALARARVALARLPKGYDATGLKAWIGATEKESKDPKFGRTEGFQYIDDIDP